ncbi:MAG: hypothetical protein J0H07_00335 [Sphingobacteriales bacterium]|nr:hypothetical protein [Sphingobacteriales bacterium]
MFRRLSVGVFSLVSTFVLLGCHSSTRAPETTADSPAAARPALPMFKRNPELREHVSKEPVAEYKVKTSSKLNDMYFIVQLYETKETMKYRAKVEFEGLGGDDTVKLPDMGTPPKPVLQKGPEEYSCIIGLLDNNKRFRDLKKVYVTDKGKQLKITTLKHYIVTEDYRLVGQ